MSGNWSKIVILFMIVLLIYVPSVSSNIVKISYLNDKDENEQTSINSLVEMNTTYSPHVVVALIDTAIDVYHQAFRRESQIIHPSKIIQGFPEDAEAVNVTFDDVGGYWSCIEQDAFIWKNLTAKKLYWFPHTNIIGISFNNISQEDEYPILSGHWHGTLTSSIVSMNCPGVTIVLIQANGSAFPEAFSWAINQSWIDIIIPEFATKQLGARPEWNAIPNISRKGVENGKLIIVPGGNSARNISFLSNICGMPWVISIGGVESYSHGASIHVSRWTDYVSNFTMMGAHVPIEPNVFNLFNETYRNGTGTSASAPVAAAAFASILLQLRKELNYTGGIVNTSLIENPEKHIRITNYDIREAVNHTALYWKASDWRLGHWPYIRDPMWLRLLLNPFGFGWALFCLYLMKRATITRPINTLEPWLQMGWGFVDNSIVNDTINVLLGKKDMPEKPPEAVRFMESNYNIRERIWR